MVKVLETTLQYFARLLDRTVGIDDSVTLSSAQKGAAYAWLTRSAVAFDADILMRSRFTPRELLTLETNEKTPLPTAPSTPSTPMLANGTSTIGIDIEAVASMPDTQDFREDPFYGENFTAEEIAHCIQQANARESFCGLWAAKEAIRKAHTSSGEYGLTLRHIQIFHDGEGRPKYAGGNISIAHGAGLAVAVCVPSVDTSPSNSGTTPSNLSASTGHISQGNDRANRSRHKTRYLVTAIGLVVIAAVLTALGFFSSVPGIEIS